jgi:hypothetical protein
MTESDFTAKKGYAASLSALATRYPRLARNLVRAEETRRSQLDALLDGARLRGVDELLRHLDAVVEAFESEPALREIASLIRRAAAEIETGIEATLSGYLAVVTDAMRDVLEIEMLLLDFAIEPARIGQWLAADSRTRWREFKPAELRTRLRDAGVGRYANLTSDPDYQGHSQALHVSPHEHPLFRKGIQTEGGDFLVPDGGFWELFEHARRLLFAIDLLRDRAETAEWAQVARSDDLIAVHDAWARTQQMQEMWLAMLAAPIELQKELGREPTTAEILKRVADRLAAQQFDPRIPFSGATEATQEHTMDGSDSE